MRNATVFSRKFTEWKVLDKGLREELESKPYFEPFSAELAGLIEEAHDLQTRQEAARAEFRELTRLRQEIELRGDDLRSRIASFLRGEFGSKSEKLLRFGIVPLPRTRKPAKAKAKAKTTEETAQPTQPETSAPAEAMPTE